MMGIEPVPLASFFLNGYGVAEVGSQDGHVISKQHNQSIN